MATGLSVVHLLACIFWSTVGELFGWPRFFALRGDKRCPMRTSKPTVMADGWARDAFARVVGACRRRSCTAHLRPKREQTEMESRTSVWFFLGPYLVRYLDVWP